MRKDLTIVVTTPIEFTYMVGSKIFIRLKNVELTIGVKSENSAVIKQVNRFSLTESSEYTYQVGEHNNAAFLEPGNRFSIKFYEAIEEIIKKLGNEVSYSLW